MKSTILFARLALIVAFACSLFAARAHAAPFVYVITLYQQFGTIDLANGQFTPIGNGTPDGLSNLMYLSNGSLLSLATTGSNAGYLATINPATSRPRRPVPTLLTIPRLASPLVIIKPSLLMNVLLKQVAALFGRPIFVCADGLDIRQG